MSVGGNWDHAAARTLQRTHSVVGVVQRAMQGVVKKAKAKSLPNGPWYRPVRDRRNNILAYIVGQGCYISSVLGTDMVPHGKEV